MNVLFLSRRNLLTLLSKLDRKDAGEETQCSIIKHKLVAGEFVQTMDSIKITAVNDTEYYDSQNRLPTEVHYKEEQYIIALPN